MRYTLARNGKFKISNMVNKILKKEKDKKITQDSIMPQIQKRLFFI